MTAIADYTLAPLALAETDSDRLRKLKMATSNRLTPMLKRAAAPGASADAVNAFRGELHNRRILLAGMGVVLPPLEGDEPRRDQADGAPDLGRADLEVQPAPRRALPPLRKLKPQLELAEGRDGEPVALVLHRLYRDACAKALREGDEPSRARAAAHRCVLNWLNMRLVHVTHAGSCVKFIVRSPTAPDEYEYHAHAAGSKNFEYMLGQVGALPDEFVVDLPAAARSALFRTYYADMWLNDPDHRSVATTIFAPPKFPDDKSGEQYKNAFNLWSGHAISLETALAEGGRADGPGAVAYLKAVDEIYSGHSPSERHYLISSYAHVIQCPGELPRAALVLHGDEGTGKGALVEITRHILGDVYFSHPTNMSALTGRFANFEGKVLVFADEVVYKGDIAGQEVLKKLISEQLVSVERKGVDLYNTRSCAHVVIATNHESAVFADRSARRFAMFRTTGNGGRRRDLTHLFTREALLDIAVLLHTYQRHEDLTDIPRNAELHEQKLRNVREIDRFVRDALSHPELYCSPWGTEVSKTDFYQRYVETVPDRRFMLTNSQFWIDLGKRLEYTTVRRGHGGRDHKAAFPAIEEAAAQFARYMDVPVQLVLPARDGFQAHEPDRLPGGSRDPPAGGSDRAQDEEHARADSRASTASSLDAELEEFIN